MTNEEAYVHIKNMLIINRQYYDKNTIRALELALISLRETIAISMVKELIEKEN